MAGQMRLLEGAGKLERSCHGARAAGGRAAAGAGICCRPSQQLLTASSNVLAVTGGGNVSTLSTAHNGGCS